MKKVVMKAEADRAELERQRAARKANRAKRKLHHFKLSERKSVGGDEADDSRPLLTETEAEASDGGGSVSSVAGGDPSPAAPAEPETTDLRDEQALNKRLQVLRHETEVTRQAIQGARNLKEKEIKLRLYQRQKEDAKRLYEKKRELINERVRLIQLEREEREVDDLLDKALSLNVDEEVQRQITEPQATGTAVAGAEQPGAGAMRGGGGAVDCFVFKPWVSPRQQTRALLPGLGEEAQKENVMPDEEAQKREQHLERLREELAEKRRAVEKLHAERQKERQAREEKQLLEELDRWEEEAQKLCKPASSESEEEASKLGAPSGDGRERRIDGDDAAVELASPFVQERSRNLQVAGPWADSSVALPMQGDDSVEAPPRPPSPPPREVPERRSASAPSRTSASTPSSSRKKKEAVADGLLEQLMSEIWTEELDSKSRRSSSAPSRSGRHSSTASSDKAETRRKNTEDALSAVDWRGAGVSTGGGAEMPPVPLLRYQVTIGEIFDELLLVFEVADADSAVDVDRLHADGRWRDDVLARLRARAAKDLTFDEAWAVLLLHTVVDVSGQEAPERSEAQLMGWRRPGFGERPLARFEEAERRRNGRQSSNWTWCKIRQRVEDLVQAGCTAGNSTLGGSAAECAADLDQIDSLLEDEIGKDEAAWLDLAGDADAIKKEVSQLLFADLVHDVTTDFLAIWSCS